MSVSRRGFLGALLALPVFAKLLPKEGAALELTPVGGGYVGRYHFYDSVSGKSTPVGPPPPVTIRHEWRPEDAFRYLERSSQPALRASTLSGGGELRSFNEEMFRKEIDALSVQPDVVAPRYVLPKSAMQWLGEQAEERRLVVNKAPRYAKPVTRRITHIDYENKVITIS